MDLRFSCWFMSSPGSPSLEITGSQPSEKMGRSVDEQPPRGLPARFPKLCFVGDSNQIVEGGHNKLLMSMMPAGSEEWTAR